MKSEPRQLKELRNLMPWTWDSKLENHPPGAAAMRDFQVCDFQSWSSRTPRRAAQTPSSGAAAGSKKRAATEAVRSAAKRGARGPHEWTPICVDNVENAEAKSTSARQSECTKQTPLQTPIRETGDTYAQKETTARCVAKGRTPASSQQRFRTPKDQIQRQHDKSDKATSSPESRDLTAADVITAKLTPAVDFACNDAGSMDDDAGHVCAQIVSDSSTAIPEQPSASEAHATLSPMAANTHPPEDLVQPGDQTASFVAAMGPCEFQPAGGGTEEGGDEGSCARQSSNAEMSVQISDSSVDEVPPEMHEVAMKEVLPPVEQLGKCSDGEKERGESCVCCLIQPYPDASCMEEVSDDVGVSKTQTDAEAQLVQHVGCSVLLDGPDFNDQEGIQVGGSLTSSPLEGQTAIASLEAKLMQQDSNEAELVERQWPVSGSLMRDQKQGNLADGILEGATKMASNEHRASEGQASEQPSQAGELKRKKRSVMDVLVDARWLASAAFPDKAQDIIGASQPGSPKVPAELVLPVPVLAERPHLPVDIGAQNTKRRKPRKPARPRNAAPPEADGMSLVGSGGTEVGPIKGWPELQRQLDASCQIQGVPKEVQETLSKSAAGYGNPLCWEPSRMEPETNLQIEGSQPIQMQTTLQQLHKQVHSPPFFSQGVLPEALPLVSGLSLDSAMPLLQQSPYQSLTGMPGCGPDRGSSYNARPIHVPAPELRPGQTVFADSMEPAGDPLPAIEPHTWTQYVENTFPADRKANLPSMSEETRHQCSQAQMPVGPSVEEPGCPGMEPRARQGQWLSSDQHDFHQPHDAGQHEWDDSSVPPIFQKQSVFRKPSRPTRLGERAPEDDSWAPNQDPPCRKRPSSADDDAFRRRTRRGGHPQYLGQRRSERIAHSGPREIVNRRLTTPKATKKGYAYEPIELLEPEAPRQYPVVAAPVASQKVVLNGFMGIKDACLALYQMRGLTPNSQDDFAAQECRSASSNAPKRCLQETSIPGGTAKVLLRGLELLQRLQVGRL